MRGHDRSLRLGMTVNFCRVFTSFLTRSHLHPIGRSQAWSDAGAKITKSRYLSDNSRRRVWRIRQKSRAANYLRCGLSSAACELSDILRAGDRFARGHSAVAVLRPGSLEHGACDPPRRIAKD